MKNLIARIKHGPNDSEIVDCRANASEESHEIVRPDRGYFCDGQKVIVRTYKSDDDMDRGGGIIRIQCNNDGRREGMLIPHAIDVNMGIEIHICGDEELKVFSEAIRLGLDRLAK